MCSPRQSVVVHSASLDDQDDQDKEPMIDTKIIYVDGQSTCYQVQALLFAFVFVGGYRRFPVGNSVLHCSIPSDYNITIFFSSIQTVSNGIKNFNDQNI